MGSSLVDVALQRSVDDVLFDATLRLSIVSGSKVFLMIESSEGDRRCCGADELVEAYVKGILFPLEGEKEVKLGYTQKYERLLPARAPVANNEGETSLAKENKRSPRGKRTETHGEKTLNQSSPKGNSDKPSSSFADQDQVANDKEDYVEYVQGADGLWHLNLFGEKDANSSSTQASVAKSKAQVAAPKFATSKGRVKSPRPKGSAKSPKVHVAASRGLVVASHTNSTQLETPTSSSWGNGQRSDTEKILDDNVDDVGNDESEDATHVSYSNVSIDNSIPATLVFPPYVPQRYQHLGEDKSDSRKRNHNVLGQHHSEET